MQVLLVILVLVIHDPMHLFRATLPDGELPQLEMTQQRFQNPAIAKTYGSRYNAIIIGTSMAENFSSSEIKSKLGARAMNLAMSGAKLDEMLLLLSYTFSKNPQIKTVIWGIQPDHIFAKKEKPSEENSFPTYLYNDNMLDDILAYVGKRFFLKPQSVAEDHLWNWYDVYKDMGHFTRSHYFETACTLITETKEAKPLFENRIPAISKMLAAHPDITFYIFIPPRSALLLKKYADKYYAGIIAFSKLLSHPNARLFDFTQMRTLTMDISRYKDVGHYDAMGNSEMVSAFASDSFRLTQKNIPRSLQNILKYKQATLAEFGITKEDIARYCPSHQ